MDIKTLEALGVSPQDLADRIVDQAVSTLLSSTGYSEDNEEEVRYDSRFKKEIEARVQAAVDKKIGAIAEQHVIPRVGELIEQADMRETNSYGEPKSPSMSFKEFIAHRAEVYISESVNSNGESKRESKDAYNWRSEGPRLTVLMRSYIRETLETHAKAAVNDVNKAIAKNITQAATDAIAAAANAIRVSASA